MKNKTAIVIGVAALIALSGTVQAITTSISIAGDGTLKTDTDMTLKTNNTYAKYNHAISGVQAEHFAYKQDTGSNTGLLIETDFEFIRQPVSLIGGCFYKENVGSGIMQENDDCKECVAGAYANMRDFKTHSNAEASPTIMDYNTQMQGSGTEMAVGSRSRDENGTTNAMYKAMFGTNNMAFSARCERVATIGSTDKNLKAICPWPKGKAQGSRDWRVFAQTNRS